MYFVYILRSVSTSKYYIGSTQNLHQRLLEHNSNRSKSTKNKGPYEIIYTETYQTRSDAYKRELQIKSFKGGVAFKKLISSN